MKAEMKAFDDNETWNLVKRPKNKIVIQGEWVFQKKQNEEGTTDEYKANTDMHKLKMLISTRRLHQHVHLKRSEQF